MGPKPETLLRQLMARPRGRHRATNLSGLLGRLLRPAGDAS
jgi:hypothetical protein